MIEHSTVLILGAGASAPYGFPLGDELRKRIVDGTAPTGGTIRQVLLNWGAAEGEIDEFRLAFELSTVPSIDVFLTRRGQFSGIGKAAVATVIKACENRSALTRPKPRLGESSPDHWYAYLWSKLDAPWDKFRNNKLRIITFNYDRSLEVFLLQAMTNSYGTPEEECSAMLAEVVLIHHVYGTVFGSYGPPDPGNLVDFLKPNLVRALADGIQVIPEGQDDFPELERCRKWLLEADRICFLGFGFDPTNLARLKATQTVARALPDKPAARQIFASAKGLTPRQMQQAAERCGNPPPERSLHVYPQEFAQPHMRCLETLLYSAILG
jgi:hypothetical protein